MKYFIFLLTFFSLSSCGTNSLSNPTTELLQSSPKKIHSKTVRFSITGRGLEYYKFFTTHETESNLLFYGYNGKRHTIDILDLKKAQPYLDYIELQKEGPNGVDNVEGLLIKDKHFHIFTGQYILVMDIDGKVISRFKILNTDFQYISNNGTAFFKTQDDYLIGMHDYRVSKTKNPQKYYKTSILGKYNPIDKEGESLDIPYSPLYQNDSYGFMDVPNITYDKPNIWVTFPIDALIYKYDRSGQLLESFKAPPINGTETVQPLGSYKSSNSDASLEHFIRSNSYHKVISVNELLVRPFRDGIPNNLTDISYPMRKKNIHLTIIDPKNLTYFEHSLKNNNINTESHFISSNEIWFQYFIENEGELKFEIISMNNEQN